MFFHQVEYRANVTSLGIHLWWMRHEIQAAEAPEDHTCTGGKGYRAVHKQIASIYRVAVPAANTFVLKMFAIVLRVVANIGPYDFIGTLTQLKVEEFLLRRFR